MYNGVVTYSAKIGDIRALTKQLAMCKLTYMPQNYIGRTRTPYTATYNGNVSYGANWVESGPCQTVRVN